MKSSSVTFPKFAKISVSESFNICFRLITMCGNPHSYYRDGGRWHLYFAIKEGKIMSSMYHQARQIHGKEIVECTEEEWRKCNGVYAPEIIK